MEFLVTMTTHVPDGTPPAVVQDIRAREAAHSRELAAQGSLLRLWRPPLQPGTWRTLGLFAAETDVQVEKVLASMPLRVWRTDEVTPLAPHPNDPAHGATAAANAEGTGDTEFLTTFSITVPAGTSDETVDATTAGEADRARELAEQGHLLRLWGLPGRGRALSLWRAQDAGELDAMLASLPLFAWSALETIPLAPHPSDPARTGT